MQLLLVFTREDPHIITLKNAALNCGYTIKCCHNIEETHEAFKKVNYDLVFIDCRRSASISSTSSQQQQQQQQQQQASSNNQYDYDNICRFIRKLFHYTVIVALTHNFDERELPSVLPLLRTGFNKTFTETTNLNRCINELLTLEYGEIQNVKRLQAAHVLFTALEFSSDSIEIMNDQFKLLYANNSFEKLTGYGLNDISGQDFHVIHRNAEEFTASRHIVSQGHALEYDLNFVKANGESVNHKSIIIPVTFQGETNKIQNYVTITSLSDTNKNVMSVRNTTNNLNVSSSNQLVAGTGVVSNKRSFSLPSKKSYDFERFANMSLSLAEEQSAAGAGSHLSAAASGPGATQSSKQSNKITLSLTTPALSTANPPPTQLSNAQSINAHLLTSTPSTTSTTLNEPPQDDYNSNAGDDNDLGSEQAERSIRSASHNPQVIKNEIAKSSPEFNQDLHSMSNSVSQRKRSYDVRSTPFEGISLPPRRHSTTRFHPHTIEAPIRKVINIIAAANEKSTTEAVRLNLEKALDILRSTELYNPSLLENDKHTSDLVSGLMSNGMQRKIPIGNLLGIANRPLFTVSPKDSQSFVKNLPPEIVEILETDKQWNFDIISLERLSNKRPLVTLGLKIMNRFDVCDCLKIDEKILVNWLTLIETNYKPANPYHNSTHASDVLHATSFFLSADKISDILDVNDKVASLIAAAVHDLNHPGRTNAFLCNSNSDLAILYNDQAVLENHHVSLAFQLTRQTDDANIFKNLTRDEYRALRSIIIDMVLATEMSKHFEHLNKFLNKFGASDDDKPQIKSLEHLRQPDNRTLIKRILIKCADVSNPCRPLDICKEWSKRIAAEYFEQTDEEKNSNLPVVMPTFDRQSCNIPKAQLSFIEYFINDMFAAWDEFADIPEVMSFLQANTLYWRECAEAQQLQLLQHQAQLQEQQQQQQQQQGLPANNIINEDNENERD